MTEQTTEKMDFERAIPALRESAERLEGQGYPLAEIRDAFLCVALLLGTGLDGDARTADRLQALIGKMRDKSERDATRRH